MKTKVRKKIRKDDNVLVIAGNCKGKTGKVMRMLGDKVYIQGVNMRKKHVRPTQTAKGGIIEMEFPVHISNLSVCVDGNKPVKLKVRVNEDGRRELYYKEGSDSVTYRHLGPK